MVPKWREASRSRDVSNTALQNKFGLTNWQFPELWAGIPPITEAPPPNREQAPVTANGIFPAAIPNARMGRFSFRQNDSDVTDC